ncbi:MAG TPA: diacylglycerol kinase family lipid kinase [Bacteroidetes bacterium]|nr:diacylglycerol kinase family lipid kinase [Bacteroidota bacterium]
MIAFIVNPAAAAGRTGKLWPRVEAEIRRRWGSSYVAHMTEHPLHAVDLTRRELRKGAEIVVSVGGDGTLNEVVNGFFLRREPVRPEAALGMLCFGTGADFVRSTGWPKDYHRALDRLKDPRFRRIDLGWARFTDLGSRKTERLFLNIADFGIGGAVVDRVNRSSKRLGGRISFLSAILVTFLTYRNQTVEYRADGGRWQRQVLNNFIIGNGRYFGGGLNPAPEAELDDGLFDVVLIGDVGFWEAVRNLPRLRRGTHLSHPKISFFRAKSLEARSEAPHFIDMDGECVGQLPLQAGILHRALRICT